MIAQAPWPNGWEPVAVHDLPHLIVVLRRDVGSSIDLFGSRNPGAETSDRPLVEQTFFQGREEEQHVIRPAAMAHEPDAPHLAFEVAESAADLDAELREQLLSRGPIIRARRDADR